MKGKAIIVAVDGSVSTTEFENKMPGLEFLQTAVGGYIETVPGFSTWEGENVVAFCNEEGKLTGQPVNETATLAWRLQFPTSDVLVGDIVILEGDDEFMEAL